MRNFFPTQTDKVFKDWNLMKIASLALLIIIWSTFDQAFSAGAFTSVEPSNNAFVVCISFALFLLWFGISFVLSLPWLSRRDTISVVFCVPSKTPAMGIPIISVIFLGLSQSAQAKTRIPMVVFQGIQSLLSSLLTIPLRKWVDKKQKDATASGENGA